MKRGEVLAAIADLTCEDFARQKSAIAILEAIPRGYLEDHPLPRKKVAPYIPRLAQLLRTDSSLVVKKWCVQLIGESAIKSPEILSSLIIALDTDDGEVRASALWAIGRFRAQGVTAAEAILHQVTNPNREVRWRAVWALLEIRVSGQEYPELFATLFDDADRLVRGYAVLGFLSVAKPSPWSIAQLQRAAKDEDEMPRIHAQRALELWAR